MRRRLKPLLSRVSTFAFATALTLEKLKVFVTINFGIVVDKFGFRFGFNYFEYLAIRKLVQ